MLRFLLNSGVLILLVAVVTSVYWLYSDKTRLPADMFEAETDTALRGSNNVVPSAPTETNAPKTVESSDLPAFNTESLPAVEHSSLSPQAVEVPSNESSLDDAKPTQHADLAMAEAQYRAILQVSDDPDAYCELGHILLMRHQTQEASDVYLKAAEVLIAQHRLSQAQGVIDILNNLNPLYAQQASQALVRASQP